MTRRELLTRVLGAGVAAAVAPLIDLTDQTPAFWNQPPLKRMLPFPWRITFPSGEVFSFDGVVIAERVVGENVEFTIQPRGPLHVTHVELPESPVGEPRGAILERQQADGFSDIAEIQEVEAPTLVFDELWLNERPSTKITVNFKPEFKLKGRV